MITIASKSALSIPQIADKARKGSHFMEVHLGSELDSGTPEELFASCAADGRLDIMDIVSVHSPLLCGTTDGDTMMERPADERAIRDTMHLAQMLAERKGHELSVIVHVSTALSTLVALGALDGTVERARRLADAFDGVRLCLECHSPYAYRTSPPDLIPLSTASIEEGSLRMANTDLAHAIAHLGVTAMVDTAHLTMVSRWLGAVGAYLGDERIRTLADGCIVQAISEGMEAGMHHIHFARAKGHGYGPDRHGVGFHEDVEDEREEAARILSAIVESGFDGNLVIETTEADYMDAANFESTLATVGAVLDAKGIAYRV